MDRDATDGRTVDPVLSLGADTLHGVVTYPTEPTGRDARDVAQTAPEQCPNGHGLGPRQAHLTFGNPSPAGAYGTGERQIGWRCRTCDVIIWADGTVS